MLYKNTPHIDIVHFSSISPKNEMIQQPLFVLFDTGYQKSYRLFQSIDNYFIKYYHNGVAVNLTLFLKLL